METLRAVQGHLAQFQLMKRLSLKLVIKNAGLRMLAGSPQLAASP
jgi:hypothetical protein